MAALVAGAAPRGRMEESDAVMPDRRIVTASSNSGSSPSARASPLTAAVRGSGRGELSFSDQKVLSPMYLLLGN